MPKTCRSRVAVAFTAVSLCLLGVVGCGGGRPTVKGTLTLPPTVQLKDNDSVQVMFIPADPNAKEVGAGIATYDPANKTFVAKAADGKGLVPGKYKVSVSITPYPGSEDSGSTRADDIANALSNAANANLTYEVTSDYSQTIDVDLVNGKITKK